MKLEKLVTNANAFGLGHLVQSFLVPCAKLVIVMFWIGKKVFQLLNAPAIAWNIFFVFRIDGEKFTIGSALGEQWFQKELTKAIKGALEVFGENVKLKVE